MNLLKILSIELKKVISRARHALKCKITVDDSVIPWILDQNDDNKYGARPIKRLIKTNIQDTLTEYYINKIAKIDKTSTINISIKSDKIYITQTQR